MRDVAPDPRDMLRVKAFLIKEEREKQYNGLNTWDDWSDITFVDMVLSKLERAYQSLMKEGLPYCDAVESLRDAYNYLLELKVRLRD